MHMVMIKLNAVKTSLRALNVATFGYMKDCIRKAKVVLQEVQDFMASKVIPEELYFKELVAHADLDLELSRDEARPRFQCKLKWLQGGGRNSALFHALLCGMKVNKPLSSLLI